jgi:uncharacterized protein (DUF3820 family)
MPEKNPATEIVPFGKYKGKPVEALREDRGYLDWLMGQDWFRDTHPSLFQIIINNFGEPTETPEHNRLQTQFLDDQFCLTFLSRFKIFCDPRSDIVGRITHLNRRLESNVSYSFEKRQLQEELEKNHRLLVDFDTNLPVKPYPITFTRGFEVRGWDVELAARVSMPRWEIYRSARIYIEIKPSLGDDFPATLRQMKANKFEAYDEPIYYLLLIDQFAATGAALDQVKQIFGTANFGLITVASVTQAIS